jgi:hypothetical protein
VVFLTGLTALLAGLAVLAFLDFFTAIIGLLNKKNIIAVLYDNR